MNNKWRSYDAWFLRYKAQQTEFFVILGHYLPFDPPNNLKKQSFEKMKKTPEDNIILHLHTTNDDYTMYSSWDMEGNRQNFFVILDYFLPFYPSNNRENQNFEKMKNIPIDIIILHVCTINENHMMQGSWDMKLNRVFSHFDHFLPFYSPNNPENQDFEKMKKHLDISSFHTSVT